MRRWLPTGSWLPFATFALAVQGLFALALTSGRDPFAPETWSKFDSARYLSIAEHGYSLTRCVPPEGRPHEWCGNAGWFPGFPYATRVVAEATPLSLAQAGVAVSWAFSLATLFALWHTFLARRTDTRTCLALVLAVAGPGAIYRFAVFPLAMAGFFAVLALWCATQDQPVRAGVAAALCGFTYELGAMTVVAAGICILVARQRTTWLASRRALLACGLGVLGPLIALMIMRLQTGAWDAFFKTQAKYGHSLRSPIYGLWDTVHPLFDGHRLGAGDARTLQTLFVTALVLLAVVAAISERAKSAERPGMLTLIGWAVAIWAVPLSQTNVDVYRSQALLIPAAALVARLDARVAVVAVGPALWLAVPMTIFFFTGQLE